MAAEQNQVDTNHGEVERLERVFKAQRAAFRRRPYPDVAARRDALDRVRALLLDHQDEWVGAVSRDFTNRATDETLLAEVLVTLEGVKYYRKRLRRWMKPSRRSVSALSWPGSAWVEYQPMGVVGIIVPWNYPIQLAVAPLVAALAAGNRVMIKMSEAAPSTGALLQRLVAESFPEDQVAVFNGEVEVGQAFSALPFDHLLFTGSTDVGRHIMRAAAEHLVPVTLELGGKSPCIIAPDYPVETAVERIAFGKCMNAGQTCVAPDYVLCHTSQVDSFVDAWQARMAQSYPKMVDNPDYTAIINPRQRERLLAWLSDAREKGARVIEVNPAGEDFSDSQKLPPALVLDVTDDMILAREEIFGPWLVVQSYDELDQAIAYVNARPRPLALYYFDWDKANGRKVLRETHAGGVCLNDTISHVGVDDLPFGGVGDSGMGAYHGPEGFRTFSKAKGVYRKGRFNAARFIMPPYGRRMHRLIRRFMLK